jgi:hypothetical protein
LVVGGPLYQLLCRAHLSGNALELIRQRIVALVGVAWLPLLMLSTLERHVLGGTASLPFLSDIEVHVRFLVALPLLIVAELVVHRRMRRLVRQFVERRLIDQTERSRFDAAVASAFRLRNSIIAELLLLLVVYAVGISGVWRHFIALSSTATWYAEPTPSGMKLSLTGLWYVYVSLPIFQFLLARWYYRIFIWVRFLWQVSRLKLSLVPTHPDRVCGLGFLADVAYALTPLAVAHGAMLAGPIANRIFYVGAQLTDFKVEIVSVLILVTLVVFGPFLVFAPRLAAAKRKGLDEYGRLAERYVREFDAKWVHGTVRSDEQLIGTADIQSLADLANSFDVVKTVRLAPITKDALIRLIAATAAPVLPLVLTMMSLEELTKRIFGLLF